ncbi:MAG: sugar phosphate isomerase/epimerase [Caldilineaceae bacterium]|nr:sugar phosphate isomerase/epimerase [Caldilineaceae bacterium]MDE0337605.1 sugar phosphate isomerase/epimerase [Caldilineaceae bacterium]
MTSQSEQPTPASNEAETSDRPILISAMQFEEELKSGECSVWEFIDIAHQTGADGVELRRETWPRLEAELAEASRRIAAAGLLVTYATQATLFDSPAASAQLRQDIDTAATLGAPIVRFFPGATPLTDDRAGWDRAQRVVDYAAAQSTVIALENYARTPGGTLAEVQGALSRLASPALRTNLDMGNYPNHGQDVVAAIDTLSDQIVAAHLKDKTANPSDPPVPLGAGVLPLAEIISSLDQLPQRVYYIFEFRGAGDPVGGIQRSLSYLKQRESEAQ